MERYRYKVIRRNETEYTLEIELEAADESLAPRSVKAEFRKWSHPGDRNSRYPREGFELGSFVDFGAVREEG